MLDSIQRIGQTLKIQVKIQDMSLFSQHCYWGTSQVNHITRTGTNWYLLSFGNILTITLNCKCPQAAGFVSWNGFSSNSTIQSLSFLAAKSKIDLLLETGKNSASHLAVLACVNYYQWPSRILWTSFNLQMACLKTIILFYFCLAESIKVCILRRLGLMHWGNDTPWRIHGVGCGKTGMESREV